MKLPVGRRGVDASFAEVSCPASGGDISVDAVVTSWAGWTLVLRGEIRLQSEHGRAHTNEKKWHHVSGVRNRTMNVREDDRLPREMSGSTRRRKCHIHREATHGIMFSLRHENWDPQLCKPLCFVQSRPAARERYNCAKMTPPTSPSTPKGEQTCNDDTKKRVVSKPDFSPLLTRLPYVPAGHIVPSDDPAGQ